VLQREGKGQIQPAPAIAEAANALLSSAVPGADAKRVEDLVFNTVDDMRKSFNLTLVLSKWLFIAGLVMLALAFLAALGSDKLWAVGVSGGAGILSLLLSALRNPLDRIRNAAGNLAQIQAAYLGFYKQLYMLGSGAPASSTREDTVAYASAIQQAAQAMVSAVGTAIGTVKAAEPHGSARQDRGSRSILAPGSASSTASHNALAAPAAHGHQPPRKQPAPPDVPAPGHANPSAIPPPSEITTALPPAPAIGDPPASAAENGPVAPALPLPRKARAGRAPRA
jgi:hypothetical protein